MVSLTHGKYNFVIKKEQHDDSDSRIYQLFQGAVYVVLINEISSVTGKNIMHILWMVPQYIFTVIAELMFSISGNEFVYAEPHKV